MRYSKLVWVNGKLYSLTGHYAKLLHGALECSIVIGQLQHSGVEYFSVMIVKLYISPLFLTTNFLQCASSVLLVSLCRLFLLT